MKKIITSITLASIGISSVVNPSIAEATEKIDVDNKVSKENKREISVDTTEKIELKTVFFEKNKTSNLVDEKKQTKIFEEKSLNEKDSGLSKKIVSNNIDKNISTKKNASTEVELKTEAKQKTAVKQEQNVTQKQTQNNKTTSVAQSATPQQNVVSQAGSKQDRIYQAALSQIGVYQDCTMLVTNSLRSVGINFHDWPIGYFSLGTQVSASEAVPGDLVYYANGGTGWAHIAVYAGNGQAIHGGWNGNQTVLASVNVGSGPVFIRVR